MKLHGDITIGGQLYTKCTDIAWYKIYPFFLLHMLIFGGSGFFMAYGAKNVPVLFLYLHGGFAILIYSVFYLTIFGVDEVKWMFINAALSSVGIYSQIGWLLSLFHKRIDDYPFYINVIPFLYFVLYTFLIRHAFLDVTGSREDDGKKKRTEYAYIVVSIMISAAAFFLERR